MLFSEEFIRKKIGKIVLIDDSSEKEIMIVKREVGGNQSQIPCSQEKCKPNEIHTSFFDSACEKMTNGLTAECKDWYQNEMKQVYLLVQPPQRL